MITTSNTRLTAGKKNDTVTYILGRGEKYMSLGMLSYTYYGHSDKVLDIAWSPDSKYIASGSVDQTVQEWNVTDRNAIFTYRRYVSEVGTVAWSPDSSRIASAVLNEPSQLNLLPLLDAFTGT